MSYEAFSRPTGIDWGSADKTYGQVRFGDDSQLVVLFYTRSVFNAALSQAKGARQYENQTWVKMHPPGEKLNIIDRPVQEGDKVRFPQHWNMFLQNKQQIPDGTPIDLLFPNNPATADNLRAFGIHTIQQCAKISAHAVDSIGMGATDWKNMAIKYLENATSGAAFLQLQAEVAKKDQEIKILNRQFEQLKAQYDSIIKRFDDPNRSAQQPGWIENYDVQADRLNANHPSSKIAPVKKPVVREEDFETVDVSKEDNPVDDQLDFGFKEK